MLDVGELERMTKHKHVKRPLDPAIGRADDALSRELREAARLLIDLYLWRKRPETGSAKPTFDDEQQSSTM
jgi:hypothetical protein